MFTTNATRACYLSRRYCKSFRVADILLVIIVTINCMGIGGGSETGASIESLLGTEHIEKSCVEKCPNQDRNTTNGIVCIENCDRNQCADGCRLWETAFDTSCKVACSNTSHDANDWSCVMGCNNAISLYFKWLMAEIGTPPAPALLADSLTATSLSLEWQIPERLAAFMQRRRNILRNYLVQWRYEESGNDWKYCRNQSMEDNSTIRVENLQPYTKYRFRVALILSAFREIELYSEQSLVIITGEQGSPQSEPTIVRAVAVDHTRISVSWEAGLLKNGPILFYVLEIKDTDNAGYIAYKDIPKEEKEILIEYLKPSTNYTVELRMRNKAGLGPPAAVNITTTPKPDTSSDDETLKLIIVSDHQILMQGPKLFFEPPHFIYNGSSNITGIGIHVKRNLLFITDSGGSIFSVPLNSAILNHRSLIYSTESTNQIPLALSVDWLNDKLYVLFESNSPNEVKTWQMSRCNFDGSHLQVVYSGLQSKPVHFQVDPFNGYLFWSLNVNELDSGIFRLDLSDVSNGVKHEINPTSIFKDFRVGVFNIDYVHYKLIVPDEASNTVIAMDLNGNKSIDIRNKNNTQTPMFERVRSLAMANNKFYWTNGEAILMEEYHEQSKFYYNSRFNNFAGLAHVSYICVKLPSAQPTPKPLNPPKKVQVLLSSDRAKVFWEAPHLLGIQGRRAWQNWTYELEVVNEDADGAKQLVNQIKGLQFTVGELEPNTRYRFRVSAYTSAGNSPHSVEFRGQTLDTSDDRHMLWASHDGLVQSDVVGDSVHILVPHQKYGNCNVSSIDWFEDSLLFVCNSQLYTFNRTTNVTEKVNMKDSIQAIAVDWIGERLYWFNPMHQVVARGNFVDYEPEVLFPLSARDTDLKIDALRGFLYISTGHSIEFCRLSCNDKDKREFYRMEAYSGKIMGLTLSPDTDRVYWIVRNYEGSTLISAAMANAETDTFVFDEHVLAEGHVHGPLVYLSHRLLWLQDDHTFVIGNMTGKNLAYIRNVDSYELKAFTVIDPKQRLLPSEPEVINVIPEAVDASTIQVVGQSHSFSIRWQPVQTVTYGNVFYDIRFSNQSYVLTSPSIKVTENHLPAYSQLNITIKAFTYWGSSPAVKVHKFSPPTGPSKPQNARIFITHLQNPFDNGSNIMATFRWNQPQKPNGPLDGYKVSCWYENGTARVNLLNDFQPKPDSTERHMMKLPHNVRVVCKVKAVNIAGEGNFSALAQADTSVERPVPRLIAASNRVIYRVDFDLNRTDVIVTVDNRIDHLCYHELNEQLFWIDENGDLISYQQNRKQKLLSMNAAVQSFTIDWIERVIYWSQTDQMGSSIMSYNLFTQKVQLIQRCKNYANNLKVAPLNRALFWIEMDPASSMKGSLWTHQLGDKQATRFVDAGGDGIVVSRKIFYLDTFDVKNDAILWLNEHNRMMATEIKSRATHQIDFTFPSNAMNLAKDSKRFYWTHGDILFAQNLDDQKKPYQFKLIFPLKILPMHRQNYPDLYCLLPQKAANENAGVLLKAASDRSLTLRLPRAEPYDNCSIGPMQMKYRIFFDQLASDADAKDCGVEACDVIETVDSVVRIPDLKPFTKYQFQLEISNYYTDRMNMSMDFTEPVIYRTSIGAPTQPRNVTVKTLSPTEINISWLSPLEINADSVEYVVQYQTEDNRTGSKKQTLIPIKENDATTINVTDLQPNKLYRISVDAKTSESTRNQSVSIDILTLPDPDEIDVELKKSESITVHWPTYAKASRYVMYCRPLDYDARSADMILDSSNLMHPLPNVIRNGNALTVLRLHPKTQYVFWVLLYFENRTEPYKWPPSDRFVFETLSDKPKPPGKPSVRHLQNDVFKIDWTAAENNGSPITNYRLEGLRFRVSARTSRSTNATQGNYTLQMVEEIQPQADEWNAYYEGNETYWISKDLTPISLYSFRVKAQNAYGWGNYSQLSEQLNDTLVSREYRDFLVLAVAAPILMTFLVVIFSCILCAFRRRATDKKGFQESIVVQRADVELTSLGDLPRIGNFIQCNNILYNLEPLTDSDIATLPHVQREQITTGSFLGSGAFGEVYEGFLRDGVDPKMRIAIKTLRKGGTEKEKANFLREAQLMSNFKHKNILSLIGVCFDTDALYIIMELMQGGDLLSFLRRSRQCGGQIVEGLTTGLTLLDLMTMCVDIASGCRYLEEMHFVHRDLACRNCLVSSMDPGDCVVKIGDFGLTRDVYKNDYYRKDGEGMLPVRWMSPESLVDGVFTSQSDVWAFGVLCWEIVTIGQQPYPARTNIEVFQYIVRDGGQLDKPANCPEELYQLMLKCWSYRSEERPTFRYCLDVLQSLRQTYAEMQVNLEETGRNLASSGIFNRLYLLADENHNHREGISKYVNTDANGQFATEHYETPKSNEQMPKYLEIIHDDSDAMLAVTTYETPVSTPWRTDDMKVQSNSEECSPILGGSSGDAMLSNASTTDDNRSIQQITEYADAILAVTLPTPSSSPSLSQPTDHSIEAIEKHLLRKSYVNSNLENAIRSCDGITSM